MKLLKSFRKGCTCNYYQKIKCYYTGKYFDPFEHPQSSFRTQLSPLNTYPCLQRQLSVFGSVQVLSAFDSVHMLGQAGADHQ